MKKCRKLPLINLIIMAFMLCMGLFCSTAMATQEEEQTVSQALSSYGLKQVKVSITGETVRVRYLQRYSEFKALDEAAVRVAEIARLVNQRLSGQRQVFIEQLFDDDQIVEVAVATADAERFLNKELSTDGFLKKVTISPLTRGVLIVPGLCEPDKGKNCRNCQACVCYPNEVCAPADPRANKRGCVAKYIPENAHLVGSEYVCNAGYKWNSDITGCIDAAGSSVDLPDGKSPVSTGPVGAVFKQILLLESIPPSTWAQKSVFAPGDSIYVWVESGILNSPHTLEIVWASPSGEIVKREQFELRGWGSRETLWSELNTSPDAMQGRWTIELLIDGSVEAPISFVLRP
ncbi:MAG: hypothetical protein K9M96_13075 [Deltaproteobacteria bacterium]|nr:hypothetical protein [Deltaproteobacteria bacterium]